MILTHSFIYFIHFLTYSGNKALSNTSDELGIVICVEDAIVNNEQISGTNCKRFWSSSCACERVHRELENEFMKGSIIIVNSHSGLYFV